MKNKLILTLITLFLPLFCINCVKAEELNSKTFNDNSGIKEDFANSNLNIKDYVSQNDSQFNKYDVVLLTESLDTDNTLLNYIYVYNPFRTPGKYTVNQFNYKFNGELFKLPGTAVDTSETITKYKVDTDIMYDDKVKASREYNFESIVVDGSTVDVDFGANVSQNGALITQEFDSYIFITDKDFVEITPINNDITKEKSLYSTDGSEYYNYTNTDSFNLLAASLFFLNFDSNKNIDQLNEIELTYKMYRGKTDYDYMGNEYHKADVYEYTELYADYSKNHKIITKQQTSENYKTIQNSIPFKYSNTMSLNLKTFYVTKTDGSRVDKFPTLFEEHNLNQKLDSGLTWRESFSKRQCSLLVDIAPVYLDGYWVFAGQNWYYYKFMIEDLAVVRINFTTDGVTYNLKCNSGAPIDSETQDGNGYKPPINVEQPQSAWEKFVDTVKNLFSNHLFRALLLIALIVLVLFVIVKLGIKAVTHAIWQVIVIIFKILLLPFKLLKSLFTRG